MSRLDDLRGRAQEQLDTLSPRDRTLAIGLTSAVAVLAVGGLVWFLHGVLDDKASRIRAAKDNLVEAQKLATQHEALRVKIDAAESKMGAFRPTQLGTYLETWAQNAGVLGGLKSPDEIGSQVVGDYREREYRVQVQRADLDGVLQFLYAIESAPYPIKVKSSSFAVVTVKDERFIDLNVQLVTYAKEEGG
jgi:hypothetical protein